MQLYVLNDTDFTSHLLTKKHDCTGRTGHGREHGEAKEVPLHMRAVLAVKTARPSFLDGCVGGGT